MRGLARSLTILQSCLSRYCLKTGKTPIDYTFKGTGHKELSYKRINDLQRFPPYFRFYRTKEVIIILDMDYQVFKNYLCKYPFLRSGKRFKGKGAARWTENDIKRILKHRLVIK